MPDLEQLQKDLQETIRALEKLPLGTLPWWLLVHPFGFRERMTSSHHDGQISLRIWNLQLRPDVQLLMRRSKTKVDYNKNIIKPIPSITLL